MNKFIFSLYIAIHRKYCVLTSANKSISQNFKSQQQTSRWQVAAAVVIQKLHDSSCIVEYTLIEVRCYLSLRQWPESSRMHSLKTLRSRW